ncbi:histidine phosphatase family protein [Nocardia neocaledoniensis]|uniref:histidine phosphatase family protein n=1 Tax=Nocardia neocaledoniensis TaxID=236511 RepID=UPI0024588DC8|nr:histidine phosphatase family protein [Nocardia neocaledoniensis]
MQTVLRVDLVGHGLTEAVRKARFPVDEPLDESGRAAVRRVAVRQYTPPADAQVRTAPERRARETAEALGVVGEVDARLRDLDAGSWRGTEMSSLAQDQLFAWLTDPEFRGHRGESVTDLVDRARFWLAEIASAGRDTVAVTHPAVIRAALLVVLDAPPKSFWRIDIPPGCVTRLHYRGTWTLRMGEP